MIKAVGWEGEWIMRKGKWERGTTGDAPEERSKGQKNKDLEGRKEREWGLGFNNSRLIHLLHYSRNKEAIHEHGTQILQRDKEGAFSGAYSSHITFTVKAWTETETRESRELQKHLLGHWKKFQSSGQELRFTTVWASTFTESWCLMWMQTTLLLSKIRIRWAMDLPQ